MSVLAFQPVCLVTVVDGKLVRLTTPEQLNAANVNANLPLPYSENGVTSRIAIEDGSYLRLNTLTLGYSLPDKVSVSYTHLPICFFDHVLMLLNCAHKRPIFTLFFFD